jgi:putative membrane protein insertion efficiency factor
LRAYAITNASRYCCGFVILLPFFIFALLACFFSATAHDGDMRGPSTFAQPESVTAAVETSPMNLAMQGTIRAYQLTVSRINPDRCGFRPSCSAFGSMAIKEYGAATGILMTADRLMRCNIWKEPGPDYLLLPGGKLLDLPRQNLLAERPSP